MKKLNIKKRNKIIAIITIIVIVVSAISYIISINIRKNKINSQVLNNINESEKYTTIFCSGKNIVLKDEMYQLVKSKQLDLVVSNKDYVAKIKNEEINNKNNIDIKVEKKTSSEYNIKINSNGITELGIYMNEYNHEYVSQYSNEKLVTNKAVVTPDGYTDVELVNDSKEYILKYVVPNDIDLKEINLRTGISASIDESINENDYTYNSVTIECNDKDAIEIDGFKITGKKAGQYILNAKSDNFNKEANLNIEQSVEKIEVSNSNIEITVGNEEKVTATIVPDNAVNKDILWKSLDESIVTVDKDGNIKALKEGNCEVEVSTKEEPIVTNKVSVVVKAKNKVIEKEYPSYNTKVEGITYVNGVMLVNKTHPVPKDYSPGLQTVAYDAFLNLRKAAALEGFDIQLLSGYRSYETQTRLYNNYVATYGQAEADTFSARPGTSEHQTGLAIDLALNQPNIDFICPKFPYEGICQEFRTLAPNYGFIERYKEEKKKITQISKEEWHFRYVGYPHSKFITDNNLCLEEYIEYLKQYRYPKQLECYEYKISYIPYKDENEIIKLNENQQISGNNVDGFILSEKLKSSSKKVKCNSVK